MIAVGVRRRTVTCTAMLMAVSATNLALLLLAAALPPPAESTAAAPLPAEQCGGEPVNASSTPFRTPGAPATFTFPAVPAPRLVPFPASLQAEAAYLPLAGCAIRVGGTAAEQKQLLPLATLLAAEVKAATDGAVRLPVVTATSSSPTILLSLSPSVVGGAEAYSLSVSGESATLTAPSYAGMVAATATLLQAVERSFDYDAVPRTKEKETKAGPRGNCTTAPAWRLPAISVHDQPALPYRGIMVDAARAFLPLSALKGFVTLCRLYKLNYIHIHLSDDGAFSFPSKAFPELARQSPWAYNLTELHELQAFASARGVAIIGEMDVPGHAASMVRTLPHIFGFPSIGEKQVGIVDFTNTSVVSALQTIFDEISEVFPSPYVHMGGDEVSCESPICTTARPLAVVARAPVSVTQWRLQSAASTSARQPDTALILRQLARSHTFRRSLRRLRQRTSASPPTSTGSSSARCR